MTVPIVEENGDINEISLPGPPGDDLLKNGVEYKLYIFYSDFTYYNPDINAHKNKLVYVGVYIHPKFMLQGDEKFRADKISKFIDERAKWIFSYGTRIEVF